MGGEQSPIVSTPRTQPHPPTTRRRRRRKRRRTTTADPTQIPMITGSWRPPTGTILALGDMDRLVVEVEGGGEGEKEGEEGVEVVVSGWEHIID